MSEDISLLALTASAERVRKQIKEMIPKDSEEQKRGKAERLPAEVKGGVMYGGGALAKKVSELVNEMKIGQVCDVLNGSISSLMENIVDLDCGAIS